MRKKTFILTGLAALAGLALGWLGLQQAPAQNTTSAIFQQLRGLYLAGSAAVNTGGTSTTVSLGNIADTSSTILDCQLVTLSITNPTASGQAITAVQLQFTDTIGGVSSTISYNAIMPSTLATGSNATYSIPTTQGVLKTAQVVCTFAANPTASTLNIQAALSTQTPTPLAYDALEVASAARTSGYIGPTHVNTTGSRGILIYLNVTAASGPGGLQCTLENLDPVSGQWAQANSTPTAITASGLQKYMVYPGAASTNPGSSQTASGPLCRQWRIHVFAGDATSYTYSLGYTLLP